MTVNAPEHLLDVSFFVVCVCVSMRERDEIRTHTHTHRQMILVIQEQGYRDIWNCIGNTFGTWLYVLCVFVNSIWLNYNYTKTPMGGPLICVLTDTHVHRESHCVYTFLHERKENISEKYKECSCWYFVAVHWFGSFLWRAGMNLSHHQCKEVMWDDDAASELCGYLTIIHTLYLSGYWCFSWEVCVNVSSLYLGPDL